MEQIDELLGMSGEKGILEVRSNEEFSKFESKKGGRFGERSPSFDKSTSFKSKRQISNDMTEQSVI